MKFSSIGLLLILGAVLLAACSPSTSLVEATSTSGATPTLPPPGQNTFQAPDAKAAASEFLKAWQDEDYAKMYGMLTAVSQDALTAEEFEAKFREVAATAALSGVETQLLSSLTQTKSAQVGYRILMHSSLVGDVERDSVMNFTLEDGDWRVQWDDALILPELAGGNSLRMDYAIPSRANIYDKDDQALVAQTDATAIGLFPDQIDEDQEDTLLNEIWRLTGIHPDTIRARYEDFPPGAGWYLPLMAVPAEIVQQRENILLNLSGLVLEPFRSRYYFDGGVAPHVVGYVNWIPEEDLEEYQRKGYRKDERVGLMGLEKWAEPALSGTRGGTLYVLGPNGEEVTKLAETLPRASQSITTTLDKELQLGAQQALEGFEGAIVVMERDTGRIRAMASSPGFDPNMFEPSNLNASYQLEELFSPEVDRPLLNRAAQGLYPLGSVFKIITMAAALESGIYTADTVYDCQRTFTELVGVTLKDWTLDKDLPASGPLTLPEGLMRSCNPYFYHIGNDLFSQGLTTAVSDMARGFGLGKATGIEQVAEEDGNVPDPASNLDATNLAIGQGDLQVTPLQVADFIAAVGNGGTLYRPQVIEQIAPPDGDPTFTFAPQVRGELPVSDTNLKIIQDALVSVIENSRGTAHRVFANFPIDVAGKTGTAEDPPRTSHAWFAGYTYEGREDKPDVAAVVIIENGGEGSEVAAPIFKGLMQLYYFGKRDPFPWETQVGVWKTPEPEETATPEP